MSEKTAQVNKTQLGFIQNVITRVAQNSFQAKTWCITVNSALLAICLRVNTDEIAGANNTVIGIAIVATVLFLLVANYYHYLEIQYRKLYDTVAGIDTDSTIEVIDYSVSLPKELKSKVAYMKSFVSFATGGFFGIVIILLLILAKML